ncbi:MAG: FecR family protein [Gammaproteobacteria bacterium]
MSTERFKSHTNRQIIEEAAEWFVEINEGEADNETRRRFHAWLSLSPEHVRAYLEMVPLWEEGAELDTGANGDPRALIGWCRAGDNVVPLAVPAGSPQSAEKGSDNRHRGPATVSVRLANRFVLAACVLVAAIGVSAWLYASRGTYSAGLGEQRVIALDDGSKIELNSRSRLKVRFTSATRSVELIDGQALFQVAKDAARPFIVRSGDTQVRAVGTQFDVYRRSGSTVVTVVEGRVAVSSPSSVETERKAERTSDAIGLVAGEQIVVGRATAPRPERTDVAVATAWTQQRLVFFRTPLTEVAEEFNRYNKRELVIKDAELRSFHVSGTFSSTDPASLLRFLRAQPELQVNETSAAIEVSVSAPAAPASASQS